MIIRKYFSFPFPQFIIIFSVANLDIGVIEIETSQQSTMMQILHMYAGFGYSLPIVRLENRMLVFPKLSFNRFTMLFEKKCLDSDIQLNELSLLLETEKYIINSPVFNCNHTIDSKVCFYAEGNVSKKRLFDALEKIAATELVLKVRFAFEACVEGIHNRRNKVAHRNVVSLSTCKTLPPRTNEHLTYREIGQLGVSENAFEAIVEYIRDKIELQEYKDPPKKMTSNVLPPRNNDLWSNRGIELLVMPGGEANHGHQENFPSSHILAQATDDLFEERAHEERSYSDEHGLYLNGHINDNGPHLEISAPYQASFGEAHFVLQQNETSLLGTSRPENVASREEQNGSAHGGLCNDGQQSIRRGVPNGFPNPANLAYQEQSTAPEDDDPSNVDSIYQRHNPLQNRNTFNRPCNDEQPRVVSSANLISSPPNAAHNSTQRTFQVMSIISFQYVYLLDIQFAL